jgi:hypothetical protein
MNFFQQRARELAEADARKRNRYVPIAGVAALVAGVVGMLVLWIVVATSGDQAATDRATQMVLVFGLGLLGVALIVITGMWAWIFAPGFVRYWRLMRVRRGAIVLTARDFYLEPDGPFAGRLFDYFTLDRGVTVEREGVTFWAGSWKPTPVLWVPRERVVRVERETRTGGVGRAASAPKVAIVLTFSAPHEWVTFTMADSRWLNVVPIVGDAEARLVALISGALGLDHAPPN